jgi:hypothetical protein
MLSLDNRRGEVRWPRCAVECLTGDSKARLSKGEWLCCALQGEKVLVLASRRGAQKKAAGARSQSAAAQRLLFQPLLRFVSLLQGFRSAAQRPQLPATFFPPARQPFIHGTKFSDEAVQRVTNKGPHIKQKIKLNASSHLFDIKLIDVCVSKQAAIRCLIWLFVFLLCVSLVAWPMGARPFEESQYNSDMNRVAMSSILQSWHMAMARQAAHPEVLGAVEPDKNDVSAAPHVPILPASWSVVVFPKVACLLSRGTSSFSPDPRYNLNLSRCSKKT